MADKLASARQQIISLTTLTAELQQAAAALERHRPDGPCDAECGCVNEAAAIDIVPVAHDVALTAKSTVAENTAPIACTLDSDSLHSRVEEWQALLAHVRRREHIAGGVRAVFDSSAPLGELTRLTAAEQDCCQFFNFAITVDARGIALEVTAPTDALPIVHSFFGSVA